MTAQSHQYTFFRLTALAAGVAAAALVAALPAQAQDRYAGRNGTGAYGTIYGGATLGNEGEVEFSNATVDSDLDQNWTGGVTLGLRGLISGVGAVRGELDANYTGLEADGDNADLWNIMANAWYDIETGGPMTPYVGGGLGLGVADGAGFDNDTGLAYQVGGGLNFDLAPDGSTFAGVGYRYYGYDTEIQDVDVDLTGHKVIGMIGVNF